MRLSHVLRTPKRQLLVILVVLVALSGQLTQWPQLVAAIATACLIDGAFMWLDLGHPRWPSSALLTALIVFMILSSTESWLVVAWTSGFAIAAKRLIRLRREHIFNPAALALVWAPLAFGSGESWWGALADMQGPWTILLIVSGAVLVDRLGKVPLVLSFLLAYFGSFTAVSFAQPQLVAEMFRPPFVQAALFLAVFMLTDPPTSPNRVVDQVWYGLVAATGAVAAQLLGLGQTYLLVGTLVANVALAAVRSWRRQQAVALMAIDPA